MDLSTLSGDGRCKRCSTVYPISRCVKDPMKWKLFCEECWHVSREQCRVLLGETGQEEKSEETQLAQQLAELASATVRASHLSQSRYC